MRQGGVHAAEREEAPGSMAFHEDGVEESRLVSIPAHLPFLDQLAARWMQAAGYDREAMGEGLIVLPGRRAARALTEAFLRRMDGGAMLLPRILPIGALDEAELGLSLVSSGGYVPDGQGLDPLDLPPAVGGMTRQAALTRLVLQAEDAFGTRPTLDQAWPLAGALATLMDEAEWAGVSLSERLPGAVQDDFAQHWQIILRFLGIITEQWPVWLASQGLMNPVARQVALLGAQASLWRGMAERGEETRLWAAGFTHAMAPTAEALAAVLACPGGRVVLPGLDMTMADAVFDALPDSHPQAGLARLLAALGHGRGQVRVWGRAVEPRQSTAPTGPLQAGVAPAGETDEAEATRRAGRSALLSRVMLPANALDDWVLREGEGTAPGSSPTQVGEALLPGVVRVSAQDEQEEALAISMIMRDAIVQPGRTVALITPDRVLASRVVTELARWGVMADDSAGMALADTPGAVLLRLIARLVESRFAPVALLSVLKHPLVACGLPAGVCRASARLLERQVLRGPAPAPGFAALRAAVSDSLVQQQAHEREQVEGGQEADRPFGPEPLETFMDRLETCLAPVLAWQAEEASAATPEAGHRASVPVLLAGLVEAAERLACTDNEAAADRLWRGEDGNLLATRLSELMLAADILPTQPPAVLDGLLGAVLAQDRAARRGDPAGLHPRVLVWGLFEARLQTAHTVILGGLCEGVWPATADAGPWMSRPMRQKVGLPSPEEAVGQAAHDFLSAAVAAHRVVLSCPRRREGAPVVPARWLTRLDAFLAGRGASLPAHPVLDWLHGLDQPPGAAQPVPPPRPCPPLALRPRRLSVTEIETWMRDPYAIYARHVLRLNPMPELEEAADASDYGMIVHDALERWVRVHGVAWPQDAQARLNALFVESLAARRPRPALRAWWEPRLARIAGWVAQAETRRRAGGAPRAIWTELRGRVLVPDAPGGAFVLSGRADRIEVGPSGRISVLDYKTGVLPPARDVLAGWSPQLPLEAAMILRGGFADVAPPGQAECAEAGEDTGIMDGLIYWRLTGGAEAGEEVAITPKEAAGLSELAEQTWLSLIERIAAYDDPAQPYLSHPHPGQEPRFADYARLARVPEWSQGRMEHES